MYLSPFSSVTYSSTTSSLIVVRVFVLIVGDVTVDPASSSTSTVATTM